MGLSPDQVMAMPLHDYQAAIYHWNRSQQGEDEADQLSETDFDEMMVGLAAQGGRLN